MLHKKFKPSKCKTALNLAKSRIKLLKNKKDVQVKQLRRELVQLLGSGQDQTARIRVEHVVREEKTMAAFELIEIYCELVVARLPILESQKDCPLDLKEAVTSLIFAAPRCGDIPELQDVCKHFTAKYGKEFVGAATELRPNCGVSRNLVEKLSAKAPDGPTKVKILTAIAEEHNIKWEPRWFDDENPAPPIEMPQKEQHMEKAGKIQMEPLDFAIADNFQHPHAHDVGRSKTSSQNHPLANIDVNEVLPSTSRPDGRHESYSDGKAFSYTSGIAENAVEAGRQNWKMEFKDATAAAQAAAESAERASMAARAAAELSRHSYIVNEASSRPLDSSAHGRNQDKNVYAGSVLRDKHVEEHPANSSFNQRTPRMQVDRVGVYQQGNNPKGTKATSFVEDSTESGVGYGSEREEYRESKNSVHPKYQEVKQSGDSLPTSSAPEAEYDGFESPKHQKYGNVPVKPLREETAKMKIQPDSFEYEYTSFGDEYGIFSNLNHRNRNYSDDSYYGGSNRETANNDNWHVKAVHHCGMDDDSKVDPIFTDQGEGGRISGSDDQKYRFNSGKDIFVSTDHGTNEMYDTKEIGAHTDSGAVFDESGSDDDESIFGHEDKSYDLPSSGKTSPKHFTFHQDSRSSSSSHLLHVLDVSESFRKSPLFAKLNEPLPIKFDPDGESLGSERELQNEKPAHEIVSKNNGKCNTNPDMGSTHKESQAVYSDAGDLHTRQPSYERRSPREESHDLDRVTVYNVVHEAKPEKPMPSSRLHSKSSDPVSELEYETQAGPEDGIELNLGLLPGGRKNRRMWDPPYRRGAIGNFSSSPRSDAGADGGPNPQVSSSEVETTQSFKKTSGSDTHLTSIGDDPGVIITPKISNSAERPYIPTIYQTANRTWKDPTGYFHSNDSSSEDDTPKQPAMSKNLLGAGLSRRTKGSAARSVASSQPSTTREHIPDSSSAATEVSPKLQTETVGSRLRHTENSGWDEPARRLRSDRELSDNAYSSSAAEKQLTPSDTETPRASNSNEKAPSRENSTKKPGHVHPKLPDFETLTAHLQSLRTNRQQ